MSDKDIHGCRPDANNQPNKSPSPIVLDLSDNGIQTLGSTESAARFDVDADGVNDGTGWIKPGTGLLAVDRNFNGKIDDGTELFGEYTPLPLGDTTADGFQAMQAWDLNHDGQLSAADGPIWSLLRVWQDTNMNGVTDPGELSSLSDLGIRSISTLSDGRYQDLRNGNHIEGYGTFQRDAAHGGKTGQLADVYFEDNPYYHQFKQSVWVAPFNQWVSNLGGSGLVRDLPQAATLDANLNKAVFRYALADTHLEQEQQLDGLVQAWAASSGSQALDQRIADLGNGRPYRVVFRHAWEENGTGKATKTEQDTAQVLEAVKVQEAFHGQTLINFDSSYVDENGDLVLNWKEGIQPHSAMLKGHFEGGQYTYVLTEDDFSFGRMQRQGLLDYTQARKDYLSDGLAMQTRLAPYNNALLKVTLPLTDKEAVDFGLVDGLFALEYAKNPVKATVDLFDYGNQAWGWEGLFYPGLTRLGPMLEGLDRPQLEAVKTQFGPDTAIGFDAGFKNDLKGGKGNNFLFGELGDDQITGGDRDDYLDGGSGNDGLDGGQGDDYLFGGTGNDRLLGGDGNDLLVGGAGNDYLEGGQGWDVYYFEGHWGRNIVNNLDKGQGDSDQIQFASRIHPWDIVVHRQGDDLILAKPLADDQITVQNYFKNDGDSDSALQSIAFADGTLWDPATVALLVRLGEKIPGQSAYWQLRNGYNRLSDGVISWTDQQTHWVQGLLEGLLTRTPLGGLLDDAIQATAADQRSLSVVAADPLDLKGQLNDRLNPQGNESLAALLSLAGPRGLLPSLLDPLNLLGQIRLADALAEQAKHSTLAALDKLDDTLTGSGPVPGALWRRELNRWYDENTSAVDKAAAIISDPLALKPVLDYGQARLSAPTQKIVGPLLDAAFNYLNDLVMENTDGQQNLNDYYAQFLGQAYLIPNEIASWNLPGRLDEITNTLRNDWFTRSWPEILLDPLNLRDKLREPIEAARDALVDALDPLGIGQQLGGSIGGLGGSVGSNPARVESRVRSTTATGAVASLLQNIASISPQAPGIGSVTGPNVLTEPSWAITETSGLTATN